ncbi:MAG TPA: hypothetical protein VM848_06535 [Acidimicrobiia bacterium]|nr:hypothetical protein [Acidimicrobiia bacterium]
MNPITDGLARGFRGLRTGDQRSLYTGALLLAYGLWKRNRGRRDLLYTRTLNPGEAILVKASRGKGHEIVVGDELADKVSASKRPLRNT